MTATTTRNSDVYADLIKARAYDRIVLQPAKAEQIVNQTERRLWR